MHFKSERIARPTPRIDKCMKLHTGGHSIYNLDSGNLDNGIVHSKPSRFRVEDDDAAGSRWQRKGLKRVRCC